MFTWYFLFLVAEAETGAKDNSRRTHDSSNDAIKRMSFFSLINFLNLHFIFYVVLAVSNTDEEEAHPLVIVKPASDRSRDDAELEGWG